MCSVALSHDVEWQRVSILVRHLPETIHLALEERLPAPLDRIVSHPALDGMDLAITGHQRLGKWQLLHLDEPQGCTRDQIEAVWAGTHPRVQHPIGEAA